VLKRFGGILEWLLEMRFCLRTRGVACARPADAATQYRSIRVPRVSFRIRGFASSSGKVANFIPPMNHRRSSRAQLLEPTRGTRMLPYAETLMPRWKKLTAESIPAPSHFSNFEDSVFDRSGAKSTAKAEENELTLEYTYVI
jgi:hypothetical protein